ncbi:MAG: hypothetical protein CSA23_07585 [Deltaproteobacteria bacterium]|nr:MAG: hypothetical protein CSA23_07585 [Deltaproteobacteria bacterium]
MQAPWQPTAALLTLQVTFLSLNEHQICMGANNSTILGKTPILAINHCIVNIRGDSKRSLREET